jgi:hypothetical protein
VAHQLDLLAILLGGATEEVAPAVSRVPKPRLHFYRCADCLSICTSPEQLSYRDPHGYMVAGGKCGACDGSLEYLGRTERDRLIKEHEACPCDDRCTSARGPNCSCRCGGENHGSNMTVTVRTDKGGIPVALINPAARLNAEAYRTAKQGFWDAWNPRYRAITDRKNSGEYIREFDLYLTGQHVARAYHKAVELRTHASRNQKIRALTEEIQRKREVAA